MFGISNCRIFIFSSVISLDLLRTTERNYGQDLRDLKQQASIQMTFFEYAINILPYSSEFVGKVGKLYLTVVKDFFNLLTYFYRRHRISIVTMKLGNLKFTFRRRFYPFCHQNFYNS